MYRNVLALVMGVAISFAGGAYAGSRTSAASGKQPHECCRAGQAEHGDHAVRCKAAADCKECGDCAGGECKTCASAECCKAGEGCKDGHCAKPRSN